MNVEVQEGEDEQEAEAEAVVRDGEAVQLLEVDMLLEGDQLWLLEAVLLRLSE